MTASPQQPPPGRLNWRAIVIVGACLVGLGAGWVTLDRIMRQRRDRQTIEWAQRAMSEGRFDDAAAQFSRAVARHPEDEELSLKSGDAFYALSASKPEAVENARVAWEQAARLDPNDLQPLRRLLRLQSDWAEVRPSVSVLGELADAARKVQSLAPADREAATALAVSGAASVLSLAGSESRDHVVADLARAAEQDPSSDALVYFALTESRSAADLTASAERAAADKVLDDAERQISSFSQANKQDAAALYRAAEALTILAQTGSRLDERHGLSATRPSTRPATTQHATTQPTTTPAEFAQRLWPTWDVVEQRVRWANGNSALSEAPTPATNPSTTRPSIAAATRRLEQAKALAQAASGLVQPSDPRFIDIRLLDARLAQSLGDFASARHICRDTLAARPHSLRAQLALAELLDATDPREAIAILERPESIDDAGPGPVAVTRRDLLIDANQERARLYLDSADSSSDSAARQQAIHNASTACDALAAMLVNDFTSHSLIGRLRVLQGRYTDAIRSLDRAMAMAPANHPQAAQLLSLRATALLALHEPQSAIADLRIAMEFNPALTGSRAQLVRTLMDEGQLADASVQLDRLKKAAPDDPQTKELQARLIAVQTTVDPANADVLPIPAGQAPIAPSSSRSLADDEKDLKGEKAAEFLSMLHVARAAVASGDFQQATRQIDQLTQLRPDEPLLFDLKFDRDLAWRNWADAGESADRLANANFDGIEGLSYRFRLLVARGRPQAALIVARQITSRHPEAPAGWIELAQALRSTGQPDAAITALQRAITLDPNNLEAIRLLASCFLQTGRGSDADKWIARGRNLAAADAGFREMEFERQLARNDPQKLVPVRESIVRAEPLRPDAALALARTYLRLSTVRCVSAPAEAADALAKAVDILNAAVKQWPDDKDCAFWAAHAAAISGDVAGGKQILRRLCDRPAWLKRYEPEELLAEFCLTWSDPASAEIAIRDAIRRGAPAAEMRQRLAMILMREGAWRTAANTLGSNVQDPPLQQLQIQIALATASGPTLLKELTATHNITPGSARVMALIGTLYCEARDDAQAAPWLDRAIEAGDDELARRERGLLRLRANNAAGAIQDLKIAFEARPTDPIAALLLGEAYIRDHQPELARQVLQTALNLSPADKGLRLALLASEQSAAATDWDRVAQCIESGRRLSPSDPDWDAAEARMWSARGRFTTAAAFMRHAVQLARTGTVTAASASQQAGDKVRSLIREELYLLLQAKAYDDVLSEADDVITRYGPLDILSAWAHHAKAAVQRRTGQDDGGATEYKEALSIAQSAGGFEAASQVVETISTDAGADEAVKRINQYLESVDSSAGSSNSTAPAHDPRWDLLRIDLFRRNKEFHTASTDADKLMAHLASLSPAAQIDLLRLAVIVDLQDQPVAADKAKAACIELLKRRPDDARALNNLAYLCIQYADPPELTQALDYATRAYQTSSKSANPDPQVADTYGWALALNHRGPEAVKILEQVTQQLTTPEIYCHLAQAHLLTGNRPAALAALQIAAKKLQLDHPASSDVYQEVWQTYVRSLPPFPPP